MSPAARGAHPAHLDPKARAALGAFYTPPAVARAICEAALKIFGPGLPGAVIDPACGAGAFLRAYAEVVGAPREGEARAKTLFGIDIDHEALALAARALHAVGIIPAPGHLGCGDALLQAWPRRRFDLVIGNPPYRNIVRLAPERRIALKARFATYRNKCDLYGLFLEASLEHLAPSGVLAMICADSFLGTASFAPLRERLFAACEHRVRALWTLGPGVFDAAVRAVVIFIERSAPAKQDTVALAHLDREGKVAAQGSMLLSSLRRRAHRSAAIPASPEALARAEAMEASGVPLGTLADFSLGVKTGADRRFVFEAREALDKAPAEANLVPCLRGRDLHPFVIDGAAERRLDYRPAVLREVHGARPRRPADFARPAKVLVRETAGARLVAAMDTDGRVPLDTLHALWPKDPERCSVWFLLGVIASAPVGWWYAQHHPGSHVKLGELRALPVPSPQAQGNFQRKIEGLARRLGDDLPVGVREQVQAELDTRVACALGLSGWPP